MTDVVEIYNLGLIQAGEDSLINPDDRGSEGARIVRAIYPLQRDAVLRAHPWNFAMRYASLSGEAATGNWRFAYQYPLPSDPYCLRVWDIEPERTRWRVAGRHLVTDAASPLGVEMIVRVEDSALFDPLFTAALAIRMASVAARRLARSKTERRRLWDIYLQILQDAKAADGQEQSADQPEDGDFIGSRI